MVFNFVERWNSDKEASVPDLPKSFVPILNVDASLWIFAYSLFTFYLLA